MMTIVQDVVFLTLVVVAFVRGATEAPPAGSAAATGGKKPLVLIVSFDGFRWDYTEKTDTPNFDELSSAGVKAKFTKDIFITKTFPNHFSLVTGLYEETHGVIGNAMYDPVLNETFSMGSTDPRWWGGGEPVWITNQKQGGKSAVAFWPSGNVKFNGILPNYYFPEYNQSYPFHARIDMIVEHFLNDDVNVGALYFHEPDHSGHLYGPDSPRLLPVIRMCDETAGYLVRRLKETGLYDRVNIIITSDHGMTSISPHKVIVIEQYVDPKVYPFRVISNNPIVSIWPHNDSHREAIYHSLHGKNEHMTVYLKEDIPAYYHYRDNRRIAPILLVAHEGWQIHSNTSDEYWPTHLGTHGYNNSLMSMHPFFIAHGPAFKQGYESDPFSSINIYALMCHLAEFEPAPNNGSWKNLGALLRPGHHTTEPTSSSDGHAPQSGDGGSGGGEGGKSTGKSISRFTIVGACLAAGLVILVVTLLSAMCLKQRTYCEKPMQYHPIADTSLERDSHEPFLPNSRL
ncbi:ectonucleotide pyrophosphatase/phosphodiesterase family member 5-like [Diadema setosum]|uniref:ectonucleotide pyrophosphatase/phosphodiesterase family member 5-like n=1 Tax=Diadema setosum TaxID=31175 RepID=UPI003B3A3A97